GPELLRIEVVVIEVHVEQVAIIAVVLDLLAALVVGDNQYRQVMLRIDVAPATATPRQAVLTAGRDDPLNAFDRPGKFRSLLRAEVGDGPQPAAPFLQGIQRMTEVIDEDPDARLPDRVPAAVAHQR